MDNGYTIDLLQPPKVRFVSERDGALRCVRHLAFTTASLTAGSSLDYLLNTRLFRVFIGKTD